MKPMLAALRPWTRVPGDRQRLDASVRQLDEILLQWVDAKGVADRERGELSVAAVGAHVVFAVAREKIGLNARVVERRVCEVAQHGLRSGLGHRGRMVRSVPRLAFGSVTRTAARATNELRRGGWRYSSKSPLRDGR